jgi:hypothetical protein
MRGRGALLAKEHAMGVSAALRQAGFQKQSRKVAKHHCPLSFGTKNTPLYLVQCDCDCSLQQNTNWVIDKVHNKIYRLSYGRYLKKSFMETATIDTEVADRLTSVRLCEDPKPKLIKSSALCCSTNLPAMSLRHIAMKLRI